MIARPQFVDLHVEIKETNPLRPLSPYAVTKVAQDLKGFQYFHSFALPIMRTRAFNHEGPGVPGVRHLELRETDR